MNRNRTHVSTVLGALLIFGGLAPGQEENPEPLELTRLREQFQTRIDQEMIPWRDKYKKELQKLEDRLIQERRLKEALAVKSEREANGGLSSKAPEGSPAIALKAPDSPGEAKKTLIGTVWLVYASDDKKREALLDVYQFLDADNVMVFSARKNFPWSVKTENEASIKFMGGDINLTLDFPRSSGTGRYMDKSCVVVLASKSDPKKN